jgi:hypothetical protein
MLSLGALLGEARGTSSNEFDLHWQRIAAGIPARCLGLSNLGRSDI